MRWIVMVLTMAALPAWAADGDFVESRKGVDGTVMDVFKLCDAGMLTDGDPDTDAATKQCAVFDLTATHTGISGARAALPNAMAFSFRTATDCAGATTVQPQGSDDSGLDPRYDLTAAVLAKPASELGAQAVIGSIQPGNRYVTAAIATGTDCTDVEVWLKLFYYK